MTQYEPCINCETMMKIIPYSELREHPKHAGFCSEECKKEFMDTMERESRNW